MLMRCLLCYLHSFLHIYYMIIKMSMIEYELKYSYVVFIRILFPFYGFNEYFIPQFGGKGGKMS